MISRRIYFSIHSKIWVEIIVQNIEPLTIDGLFGLFQIPELVRIFRNNTCKEMFFSLNLGYIIGVVAMLLLAIYEDHLKIV